MAILAIGVGALSGAASAVFLVSLDWVTDVRLDHEWLIAFLPLVGLATGLVYARLGGRAAGGTRLAMTEIEELERGVPLRMAPLVLGGTLATHLTGGSAGREGTALQMAASLTDGIARRVHLEPAMRRGLMIASIAGGFGSVFGVPWAGLVFAIEVAPTTWRHRLTALPAAVVAAVVGSVLVHLVGVEHGSFPHLPAASIGELPRLALAGLACGVAARVFVRASEAVRDGLGRTVRWAPLRPFLGGVAVIAATLIVGTTAYNGLSTALVDDAVHGLHVATWAFAAKLVLTALTVGAGFQGGEVTPLFVVGATLGSTMGSLLDVPLPLASGVAMVATFGAAAHAPVAVVVMGVELFGWSALPALVVTCAAARLLASRHHLYETLARDAPARS